MNFEICALCSMHTPRIKYISDEYVPIRKGNLYCFYSLLMIFSMCGTYRCICRVRWLRLVWVKAGEEEKRREKKAYWKWEWHKLNNDNQFRSNAPCIPSKWIWLDTHISTVASTTKSPRQRQQPSSQVHLFMATDFFFLTAVIHLSFTIDSYLI